MLHRDTGLMQGIIYAIILISLVFVVYFAVNYYMCKLCYGGIQYVIT